MSKLKELCINITDGEHGTVKECPGSEYYLLNNNNITDSGIVINYNDRRISKKDFDKIHKRTHLDTDDVVIASCGTIGKSQVIKDTAINYDFSRSVGIIKCDKNKLIPEYLHYYFVNPVTQKRILISAEGAVQKHFYIGAMEDFDIQVPDVDTQKNVINCLSSIDAKIANNKQISSELESMAQLLYEYWFLQFDFPDDNGKPHKFSCGRMIWNNELKMCIPENWKIKLLNDCITTIIDHRGKTPTKMGGDWTAPGNGVMALSAKLIKNNRLVNLDDANWVSEGMYKAWMRDELRDGDILMTSEAPLGEFYYLKGYTRYCLSQRLFAIRADENTVLPSFLFMYLSGKVGLHFIIGKQSGSTVFGIRQDELRKVPVLLPPMSVQKKFCLIVDDIYKKVRQVEQENQQLASLRDFLLPMLMNGQVKVKASSNQEKGLQ